MSIGQEIALPTPVHFVDLIAVSTVNPAWAPVLKWVLWGSIMSLVMGWVARSRLRPRPAASTLRLQHPPSTLVIGAVTFLFFGVIAVISNVFANHTTTWWTTATFVGFALLALPIIAGYFGTRHEMSEQGLRYGRLFGSSRFMRWLELKRIRFNPLTKCFRLESHSGDSLSISVMLMGLPVFARLVLARAPREAIEAATLPILQATAEGNPPSVWA